MDIAVTRADRFAWNLTDLLGRSLGRIVEAPANRFVIEPNHRGMQHMANVKFGPHASLEAALSAIEKDTHGTCQLAKDDEGST